MIELKNVSKKYGNKVALSNVNLEFPRGEIVGIFGENGTGKTTMLKAILNLIKYGGEILLDGEKVKGKQLEKISFATSEHTFFPNLTPDNHREFYRYHFPKFSEKRYNVLMNFFQLPPDKALKKFSEGQKNQFEVIMALSQGADYILMDEPFAGNDLFNREDFYKVLLGLLTEKETVILCTHLIDEVADFVSRAILIRNGEILGDISVDELDDEDISLVDYVKESYNYEFDRVSKALSELSEEE